MLKDIKNEYDNLSNIFYKKRFKDCSYHYYHLKKIGNMFDMIIETYLSKIEFIVLFKCLKMDIKNI